MRVKHLMKILEKLDPESEVVTFDPDERETYYADIKVYDGYVSFDHDYEKSKRVIGFYADYTDYKEQYMPWNYEE